MVDTSKIEIVTSKGEKPKFRKQMKIREGTKTAKKSNESLK